MIILVCGGRDYSNVAAMDVALDQLHEQHRVTLVVHGDARGADRLARDWALDRLIPAAGFAAPWGRQPRAAGPTRNAWMLDHMPVEYGVAFPGGHGTADMIRRMTDRNIPVWRPYG